VRCYEQAGSWSMTNLLQEGLEQASRVFTGFRGAFPLLDVRFYPDGARCSEFLEQELRDADVVLVHEWNEPAGIDRILALKSKFGFRALFHDTHHRAYTNPAHFSRVPLDRFDGVLAFGEAIRRIYKEVFRVQRVWNFHEAADTRHFHPCTVDQNT